jgi:hypothetical protein
MKTHPSRVLLHRVAVLEVRHGLLHLGGELIVDGRLDVDPRVGLRREVRGKVSLEQGGRREESRKTNDANLS